MSITNIEINFAANGSPHSATVTEVVGSVVCGGQAIEMVGKCLVSDKIQVNHPEIDELLKNFILESKTTTVDPRARKKEYKLIDKVSEKLERIVVLVRGINAPSIVDQFSGSASFLNTTPPNSQLKFEGPIFSCSELPYANFTLVLPSMLRGYGKYNEDNSFYDEQRNLVILGSTYNVISQEIRNEKSYQVYNGGNKIEALELDSRFTEIVNVEREDGTTVTFDPTLNQRIDPTKSTLKFGYTSKEFFDALEVIGVEFDDNPLRNKGDNLFDNSGTLKDCLSAIAGFYGYYWYVDLSDDGVVKLIDSKEAHSLEIADPTEDEDSEILSSSFTEGGRSPFIVSSFMGTTAKIENDNKGSFDFDDRPNSRRFWLMEFEKTFELSSETQEAVNLFYNFFYSTAADDSDCLKKYLFACQHIKPDVMKALIAFKDGLEQQGEKKRKSDFSDADTIGVSDNAVLLNQMKTGGREIQEEGTEFLNFAKLYFDLLGSIYISNGYSKNFTDRNEFIGGTTNVLGPFPVNDNISAYSEMKDIFDFYSIFYPDKAADLTFKKLMNAADIKLGISAEYVYVGRTAKKNTHSEDKDEQIRQFGENLGSKCKLNCTIKGQDYMAVADSFYGTLESAINNSEARMRRLLKHPKTPSSIRVNVSSVNTTPDGDSSSEGERLPMEFAYQKVKTFGKNKFCKTELKTFDGTIQDVKILENATSEQLGVIQNELNASSVTYGGLRIPEVIDITIDSISIQFGDGGISTTISRSNKNILPIDQNLIISKGKAQTYSNYKFSAGARNFFKLN
jgi:hypothetical protein